jgi:N-acetylneuraminic acid mutarotase
MKRLFGGLLLVGMVCAAAGIKFNPLPTPMSLNAVTGYRSHNQFLLFSFMGIGASKTADSISAAAYVLDLNEESWSAMKPVPGITGRIGAMAASTRAGPYVFGGYVVDEHGRGNALPDVSRYDPHAARWLREKDIPIPVGDAVIGTFDDRYIYLVGGRANGGNPVSDVQLYDVEKSKWSKATPLAGAAVFGHAGALVDDTIIYVGGATKSTAPEGPRYVLSDECWMGKINHHDHAKIQWSKLPEHPGTANFQMAAGGSEKDRMIYFSGGADALYDLKGMGSDGKPVEPSPVTFAFDLRSGKWETISENTANTVMGQSTLLVTSEGLLVVGGMEKGQQVTARVAVLPKVGKAK